MDFDKKIQQVEKYRLKIESILAPINKKLAKLLDQEEAQIFHQESDGWVILVEIEGFPLNAAVNFIDFDALFKMSAEEAVTYLGKYGQ